MMKSKMTKKAFKTHMALRLWMAILFVTAIPGYATAKSLYLIADRGSISEGVQPIHVYDIGPDGSLIFQSQHDVPRKVLGAVGIAIDSNNGFLFVTYEGSNEIQVLDARTMKGVETASAPNVWNLDGIVYDHDKQLVYCVARGENLLFVYDWDPETRTLSHAPGSPFELWDASAYGIALDEFDDLLYVANGSKTVTIYNTSIWRREGRIKLDRVAVSIAVDARRGLLYTGAGYKGDTFLTQYDLATETVKEVQVEPDAGVMGLGVNSDTGYVYLNTGLNNKPGGDNLQAYDVELNLIDAIPIGGNSTGLAVPLKDVSLNPLGLKKTIVRGASHSGATGEMPTVDVGDTVTYGVHFNNFTGAAVTDVQIVDTLPGEVIFVSADGDGVSGSYDPKTHAYTWFYSSWPPEVPTTLELVVQIAESVEAGAVISNTVMISSNETPPTTKRRDVVAGHNPLNLSKVIQGGVQGQVSSVEADSSVTYVIEFDNSNEFVVTDVFVIDVLPKEVSFVSTQKGTVPGKYDPATHTVTWSFASLKAGQAVHLELETRVKEELAKGTIFTNVVSVESAETPPASASAQAIVGETPKTVPELKVLPEVIRRGGPSYDVQASLIFPQGMGIGRQDIADVLPTLYDAGNPKAPGAKAKQLFIYGSNDIAKVIALFDKNELLEAVKSSGEVTLRMVGMLKSGRSYSGEGIVYITAFSGG